MGESCGTGDWEETDTGNDGESKLVFVGEPNGDQEDADTEHTSWDLHEDSVQRGLLVSTRTERRRGGHTKPKPLVIIPPKAPIPPEGVAQQLVISAVPCLDPMDSQVHSGPHVCLGISISLPNLIPLPLGRLGTSVVLSQSLERNQPVVSFSKEFSGSWRVWHQVPDEGGEGERE